MPNAQENQGILGRKKNKQKNKKFLHKLEFPYKFFPQYKTENSSNFLPTVEK